MTIQARRERQPSISAPANPLRRWRGTCSFTPRSEWRTSRLRRCRISPTSIGPRACWLRNKRRRRIWCRKSTLKPGSLFIDSKPGTNCRAWLFKILFHRLHHFRRRWVKAARVEPFENSEEQDNVIAETPVPQEIRDEDVLKALEKGARRIPRSCPLGRRPGVLLQGDCGNHEAAAGYRDVAIEPGTESSCARNWPGWRNHSGSLRPRSRRGQVNPHERAEFQLGAVRPDSPATRCLSQQRASG